jgi:DNA-binding NarL/FixJ family response regulator
MTSVVIVDDQAMVRQGLRLILELAGLEILAEAEDGEHGVAAVREHVPDVVLMDVRMPRVDGIEATRRIVAAGLPTRVLVLTTFDLDAHVYDALRAGAAGFLLKDVTAQRLVAAVEETAAGETPLSRGVLRRVIEQFVHRVPDPSLAGRLDDLSVREAEVLALVGAGLSNPEIAERLFISVATVKSHVRHILAKLDLRDRVQAVVLAHECGVAAAIQSVPGIGRDAHLTGPPSDHERG